MKLLNISDYLRRYAEILLDDGPRVAELNKLDINGDPIAPHEEEEPAEGSPTIETKKGPGAPMKPGMPEEAPRPTAGPDRRSPRRQPAHARKWNPGTRRQNMRQYMQEYRGTGRINERKPQVNP